MSRTSICVSIHGMIGRLVCSRHGCGGVQGEGETGATGDREDEQWSRAQKSGSGATQQAQHPVPNFGAPSCGLVLTGPPCIGGGAAHCAGPSNEEPARATIYGQNG